MRVTLAELQDKVRPYGAIGEYFFRQMVEFNDAFGEGAWPLGESWALGDSPAIGLLLDPHEYCYDYLPAPHITKEMYYVHEQNNRAIRVYNKIDARFILEDFFSKMKLVYENKLYILKI